MNQNNKLIKGTQQRYNRQNIQTISFARDFDALVNQTDSSKLLSYSRSLYHNNPLVKYAIDKRAVYSIGNAFEYRSLSSDADIKAQFEKAIKQWSNIAEVSGKNFNDCLHLICTSIDIDGDVFVLFSETKTGWPVIQLIQGHAIGSRQSGKQKFGNLYEEKGVQYDAKTKRPLFYRVLGETEDQDKLISVKDMVHIMEPSFSVRGTLLISSAIRLLQDLEQSQELLLTQHLMAAAVSLIETNESGTNEIDLSDNLSTSEGVNVEVVDNGGGEIRYYKAGTGSKLEVLNNSNPSIPWQEYQDKLTNLCLLALDFPKNLAGLSDTTGTNDRLAIQQAQKSCLDRQTLLTPYIQRICNWVLSKLIKNGYLIVDLPEDWYECYFTNPKFISVDLMRDSKSMIEEYKMGITNLADILAQDAKEYVPHITARYREEAIRLQIKAQVEKEYGVEIDDTTVRLLSQNQFVAPVPETPTQV